MSTYYNNLKDSKSDKEFSSAFNEINSLVEMATTIQGDIKSKRREIRFSFVKMLALLYFFVAIPFYLKPIIINFLGFNGYLSTIVFSLTTLLFLFMVIVFKIRDLRHDLKVDVAIMQDLMDVIFNFRKVFNNFDKNGLSLVEVTILDLKLRQLRFY